MALAALRLSAGLSALPWSWCHPSAPGQPPARTGASCAGQPHIHQRSPLGLQPSCSQRPRTPSWAEVLQLLHLTPALSPARPSSSWPGGRSEGTRRSLPLLVSDPSPLTYPFAGIVFTGPLGYPVNGDNKPNVCNSNNGYHLLSTYHVSDPLPSVFPASAN